MIVTEGSRRKKKMLAKLVFKSIITTEETYPYSVELKFALECHNVETFFDEAYEYISNIINGKIVGTTTECLGYSYFSKISDEEFKKLEEMSIHNLND